MATGFEAVVNSVGVSLILSKQRRAVSREEPDDRHGAGGGTRGADVQLARSDECEAPRTMCVRARAS